MIYIAKTKKTQKPWRSANFFKRRKSTKTVGHPVYVYKKRNGFYKYLTFTHTPEIGKESNYEKLIYNIDSTDSRDCYVKKKFEVNRNDAFENPDKKYRIHEKDRETINKYKK